ncbi:MAG: InlB B-repeat-containing protein, partial [Clostridia bacterium]|nr:InlB B-repeat-containing protein [Clostridia bacterium]
PALPEAPYKYGYTFVSWADVPAEATQDAVIRAHYQPNAHHLLYLVDDIVVFDQSVNYGDPVIAADEVSAMSEVKTWNGLPDIMPDHDVVVTATLKDDQVKVTCVVLDMVEEFFFGKNTELTLPELSEKEGYDLLGWVEEVPATVGEEDLTFHANYQPHQHFVYFMCCGEEVASFKVPYGASIEIPNVARVIDDILYDAWDNVPEQMPDEEVTIHAVGRRAGCHITFVADGEEIAVLRLTAGSTIECPEAPEKEGCDFEGWSNLPEEVDNQVIISEAIYTPRLYTVDYRVKGMPFSRVEYAYGTAIEPIEAPPVKKRRFVKWSNLPDVMPACNLVVDALYMTQHSFLLAFIIDGQPFAESVLETGTRILMPTPPEKEGYVFSGWDKQVSIIAKEPIYVNGSYKPLLNTVTYYVNGEVYASYEVLTGDPIPTPDAPETGRVFLGWTRLPQTMPASDLTAEALIGATYTVAFVADGKKLEEYVVEDGQPITVPEAPEKEGFVFEGWDGLTEVAEKDLICTAKYKPMVFTVTFMVEGEVAHTAEVVFGHTVDLPEAPEVEGMIFDGWDNLPEAMPAQDVTVSALLHEAPQPEVVEEPVVEEPAPAVLYSVVFYLGEDEYARYEVEAGQSVPTPESPAPEIGFNGWEEILEVMPENDLAIHAAMIPLYAIAYMVDGEEIASFAVLADQPVPTPESVPEKQGYTFEGWENYTGVASADLVCNAIYYPRAHRVTFMLGEEMLTQYELAYGESIAFIDAPEVEGKVFAGWDHELTVMPDADVVFSAVMEDAPIVEEIVEEPVVEEVVEEPAVEEVVEEPAVEEIPTYTLTLMCGEDIWATLTLAAGDPIAVPSRPELPDDAFDSWIDLPEVMPEQDIVVYAKYKEQLQLVRFMLDEELFTEYRIAPSVTVDMPDVPAKEGHVFSGWGSEPITDADNALVYCGRYIPNIHTVVFMVGKKIVHTITVPFGAVIPEGEVEAPTLENKTFFGWRDVPATMPDADVKLQAIFDARFAVTYLLDDVLFHEDILAPKAKIVPPEVPEKYGYTFAGWSEYPKKMRHEPITIKGTYAPNVHRVTFMNGENVLAAADVAYRTSIPLPPVPELEGYAFAGWDMVPDLMPNEDIVITAQYTPVDYGLTFVVDGVVFPEIRVGYGEPIPCPAVADRIGYTFVWENLPETMPAATLILQGKYLLNTHTVTYMANGETFAEQTFTYGEAITPITEKPKTKKRKYMFYRWENLPSVMPDQDIVALASFDHRRKVMALMKTVTYKMEGQVYQTQKVLPGDIIVPPSDPFKLGYKLIAWKDLPSVMPGEDIVVEAEFELEFCTAEFRVDDAVFYSTDLPYGAEVVAPKAPIKTGYTFIEWKNAPTQMPNYSFVSDAVYHKNIYKVSYVVGDVVVHVGEFEWGRDIPLYIPEHIPHGIFEGWQGLPSIMPAEDITVFALLSIKEFKVTYLIDRDHSTFAMVPYGELIVPPKMPIREGKGVVEWKNLPDDCLMPGRDIVVEAVWGDRRHAEAYDEYLESLTDSKEQNEKGKKKLSRKEKKRQKKENKKHKKMSKKDAARQRALDVENEIRRRMRRLMR